MDKIKYSDFFEIKFFGHIDEREWIRDDFVYERRLAFGNFIIDEIEGTQDAFKESIESNGHYISKTTERVLLNLVIERLERIIEDMDKPYEIVQVDPMSGL